MATDSRLGTAIRSDADGADARVQIKIVDKSNPGTQQASVDTDGNVHVEMHGNKPDGTDAVQRLSEEGAPNPDGIYSATLNTIPASSQSVVSTRSTTVDATKQTLRQTGVQAGSVVASDVALYDESGVPFSSANPLPVSLVNEEDGTSIHSYNETATAIAPGTPQTITYTATAITTLKRLVLSASGKVKIEISSGPSASLVQKYTVFNSENNNNIMLDIPKNFILQNSDAVSIKFTSLEPVGTTPFTGYATVEAMS